MKIVIPGVPQPELRARLARNGHCYNPKSKYKATIKEELYRAWDDKPWVKKPHLGFLFAFPVPNKLSKYEKMLYLSGRLLKTTKPDVDNLAKLYMDVMNGVVYEDDNACSLGFAFKIFSSQPRTVIWVREFQGFDKWQPTAYESLVSEELSAEQSYTRTVVQHDLHNQDHLVRQLLIDSSCPEVAENVLNQQFSSREDQALAYMLSRWTSDYPEDLNASHPT